MQVFVAFEPKRSRKHDHIYVCNQRQNTFELPMTTVLHLLRPMKKMLVLYSYSSHQAMHVCGIKFRPCPRK